MIIPADIKNMVLGFLMAMLLFVGGWAGYKLYPTLHPCPEVSTDTVLVHDTVTHTIPDTIPYYIAGKDSIIYDTVFKDVDTAAILKDYFAWHFYTRHWEDSLLSVTLHDVVSQNKFGGNEFTYKILRPQTVITNVVDNSRSRYIIFGADIPFKTIDHMSVNVDAMFVTSRFYFGIGYNGELNCPTIKGGVTVARFK